jgi:uncharacterized protein YbjT (DUF2867 family)
MAAKRTIAVVGATGAQGGGLARAILNDSKSDFAVRALTRKPESEAAQKLARQGAEVVQADLDDVESLRKAFEGCYGAFCVTNFWEHFSAEKEKVQAANLAQAAKQAGLKHVIWSTLEDTRAKLPSDGKTMPVLQEAYNVPHLDAKGEANQYFRDQGVPTTFLHTSFYWDNFIHFGLEPKRDADGALAFAMPMGKAKLPGIAVEDIGKAAYGIFKAGSSYIGKSVGIAGEHLTGEQMAAEFSEAFREEVRYNEVDADVYRSFGFPGADEMGNMFQYKRDFNESYCGMRNLEETRALDPELLTFRQWLAQNRERIPVEPKK